MSRKFTKIKYNLEKVDKQRLFYQEGLIPFMLKQPTEEEIQTITDPDIVYASYARDNRQVSMQATTGGVCIYGEEANVRWDVTKNIVSYTVPNGQTLFLDGFECNGDVDSVFQLLIGGNTKCTISTSVASPTVSQLFPSQIEIGSGTNVRVRIVNHDHDGVYARFAASIFGELI